MNQSRRKCWLSGIIIISSFNTLFSQYENVVKLAADSIFNKSDENINIGYGLQNKKDITGSVYYVGKDNFNKGLIISPAELIMGKIPGLMISSDDGTPGGNFTIINRGISPFLPNDPLLVVDDLPLIGTALDINPNDIQSITFLKDATAAAIYGDMAYNGALIITTKSGGGELKVNYCAQFGNSYVPQMVDVFSGDEFRNLIYSRYSGTPAISLLGNANTNWQKEIYQNAFGEDHLLSLSGSLLNVPYRLSAGTTNQEGIVKTSDYNRNTVSLALNPVFFSNHLNISVNFNGAFNKNKIADGSVISSAIAFDPSQAVFNNSRYGGYFTWMNGNDPNLIAGRNPMALLALENNSSEIDHIIGNIKLDYKLHFLPELKVVFNFGLDKCTNTFRNVTDTIASWSTYSLNDESGQKLLNKTAELYANYSKQIQSISAKLDFTLGISNQNSQLDESFFDTKVTDPHEIVDNYASSISNTQMSEFARLNFSLKNRYFLTGIFQYEENSFYSSKNRWNFCPAVALAWEIKNEAFLIDNAVISDLKLRAGYGISGSSLFPFLQEANAQVSSSLTGERINTTNLAVDFGLFKNRINGSIDFYNKVTQNLIDGIPIAGGSSFSNYLVSNVGDMENTGLELLLNAGIIESSNLHWTIMSNLAYDANKILTLRVENLPAGLITGTPGNSIQVQTAGYPVNSFFVFQQTYDKNGKPIEGLYVDRSGQGGTVTSNSANEYHYKKPAPDVIAGLASDLKYKNWEFSFSGRLSIGNYVYNNISSNSVYSYLNFNSGFLANMSKSVINSGFVNPQYLSDYYIENASFFRMDYLNLSYQFKKIFDKKLDLKLFVTVQNAFLITKYKGQDPEKVDGIESYMIPRPRTFSVGLNAEF
jgi:TonB-dependent starch-binding outer membrane protein SusC